MGSEPKPRMTLSTQAVLRALLTDPTRERYGLEISAATGLPSGTLHPILARFEHLGWVESDWESIVPQKEGRPRRRYYRLSSLGRGVLSAVVTRLEGVVREARLHLKPPQTRRA